MRPTTIVVAASVARIPSSLDGRYILSREYGKLSEAYSQLEWKLLVPVCELPPKTRMQRLEASHQRACAKRGVRKSATFCSVQSFPPRSNRASRLHLPSLPYPECLLPPLQNKASCTHMYLLPSYTSTGLFSSEHFHILSARQKILTWCDSTETSCSGRKSISLGSILGARAGLSGSGVGREAQSLCRVSSQVTQFLQISCTSGRVMEYANTFNSSAGNNTMALASVLLGSLPCAAHSSASCVAALTAAVTSSCSWRKRCSIHDLY